MSADRLQVCVSRLMWCVCVCVCRRLREVDRAGSRAPRVVSRPQLPALRIHTQICNEVMLCMIFNSFSSLVLPKNLFPSVTRTSNRKAQILVGPYGSQCRDLKADPKADSEFIFI